MRSSWHGLPTVHRRAVGAGLGSGGVHSRIPLVPIDPERRLLMSFGAGARRPAAGRPCPCGSGTAFGACCGPIISGAEAAATAAALMRSRYTAFAIGDRRHLLESWHPRTRPDSLDLDAGQEWAGLDILAAERGGAGDDDGTVEFVARWREGGASGALHERSRFTRGAARGCTSTGMSTPPF